MRASVRSIIAPDIGTSEEHSSPVLFQVFAGPSDGPGEEQFQVLVCTPDPLRRLVERDAFVIGRHFVFVQEVNESSRRRIPPPSDRNLWAEDWNQLTRKIAHIGRWEFED